MVAKSEDAVLNVNVEKEQRAFGWIKLGCGITSALCFGLGVRAAVQQARPLKASEISRPQLFSGVGFASRALLIATMITVSGYTLILVGVSTAMQVSSLKQFGNRMREFFGDKYKLRGSENSQEFKDIFKNQ